MPAHSGSFNSRRAARLSFRSPGAPAWLSSGWLDSCGHVSHQTLVCLAGSRCLAISVPPPSPGLCGCLCLLDCPLGGVWTDCSLTLSVLQCGQREAAEAVTGIQHPGPLWGLSPRSLSQSGEVRLEGHWPLMTWYDPPWTEPAVNGDHTCLKMCVVPSPPISKWPCGDKG